MEKKIRRGAGSAPVFPGVLALLLVGGCSSSGSTANPAVAPAPAPVPQPEAAAAEPEPAALPAGLYTSDQASRGADIFQDVCSECHTTNEFRGRIFQADWGRRSVYSFYRTVRSTMPDDNPGGLSEQVYLDVIAYILDMNGHPTGPGELSAESPMREFRIDPDFGGRE
ncbi:MAG: cytochrome c [Gemmatimonadetes bacterium]|nr:cytochrome c [Gemmatimonadota bacterium]